MSGESFYDVLNPHVISFSYRKHFLIHVLSARATDVSNAVSAVMENSGRLLEILLWTASVAYGTKGKHYSRRNAALLCR